MFKPKKNLFFLQVGTFLIRFSDSELGGVTVAWISGLQVFEFALFCCIFRFYLILVHFSILYLLNFTAIRLN